MFSLVIKFAPVSTFAGTVSPFDAAIKGIVLTPSITHSIGVLYDLTPLNGAVFQEIR